MNIFFSLVSYSDGMEAYQRCKLGVIDADGKIIFAKLSEKHQRAVFLA